MNERKRGMDDTSLFKIGFFIGLGFLAANVAVIVGAIVVIILLADPS